MDSKNIADYTLAASYSRQQQAQPNVTSRMRLECEITIPQRCLRNSAVRWLSAHGSAHGALRISEVKHFGSSTITFALEVPASGSNGAAQLRMSVANTLTQLKHMIEEYWREQLRRQVIRSRTIYTITS